MTQRARARRLILLAGFPALFSSVLFSQNYDEIQAEQLLEHLKYADGAVWLRDGYLLVSDPGSNRIYRVSPGAKPVIGRENSGGAEGLATDTQGRIYICESHNRRVTRTDRNGEIQVLADKFEGKKLNAPNDIAVRKDGQIYFTDPAFGSDADRRELEFNGVFHLNPRGQLEAIARWKTRPNGIALTADGKTLYVTDSDRHAVVAFDLDGRGGAANQRDVITKIRGVPGGVRVDAAGKIYVAGHGLQTYSRDGRLEHTFVESDITTNCAFGDADLETLYVLSRDKVLRIRLDVKGAAQ